MAKADRAGAVLEIDLAAIVANWRLLCAMHPSGPVAGVVKADGYGLGARPVAGAGTRRDAGTSSSPSWPRRWRSCALVPGPMLAVLGGCSPGSEADTSRMIVPVLGSWRDRRLDAGARAGSTQLPAILHVDTGMARLGLDAARTRGAAQDHARLSGIELRYIMTHLVAPRTPEDPLNKRQRERFAAACAGLPPAPRSFANSSGMFLGSSFGSDLARPGARSTASTRRRMRQTRCASACAARPRAGGAGDPGGDDGRLRRDLDRRAQPDRHGRRWIRRWLHRSLSIAGRAIFAGQPVPLVGRVSMDLTTFDVTNVPMSCPVTGWNDRPGADAGRSRRRGGNHRLRSADLSRRPLHRIYRSA